VRRLESWFMRLVLSSSRYLSVRSLSHPGRNDVAGADAGAGTGFLAGIPAGGILDAVADTPVNYMVRIQ